MRKLGLILAGFSIGIVVSIPLHAAAESLSKVGKQVEVEVPVRVNGELLDTPAIGIEGTTYTPARSLAETLGAAVDWDGDTGEVVIETKISAERETPEGGDGLSKEKTVEEFEPSSLDEIELEIRDINYRIESKKVLRDLHRGYVEDVESRDIPESEMDMHEIAKRSAERLTDEIEELEAKKAELEAAKAELEARQQ